MDILEVGGGSLFVAVAAGLLSWGPPRGLPPVPAPPRRPPAARARGPPGGGPGAASIAMGGGPPAGVAGPSPFLHAVAFVSGFSLVFIIFGASIGLLGFFLGGDEFVIRDQQG